MADKYKQSDRDEMAKSGEAMSDGSYPIKDEEDLRNAIKAVGRGGADHDSIRKHIIGRAKALELSNLIPENWNPDGSMKDAKALPRSVAYRKRKADALGNHVGTPSLAEVRFLRAEVREAEDGTLHLSGYASVTGTPYDMGWYTESIKRGAFAKTLAENPDVQLLVNHGGLPLARTKSGTLQLSEDNTGLRVEADLDSEDPDVSSLSRKMQRGDIDQMSFAFRATRQEWNEDYSDRMITECDIHRGDVSVVNQGANPSTSVSIRSEDAVRALQHAGGIGFLEAMLEIKAGKKLSSATEEVVTQVLKLCSAADDAMDEAQPLLAELLGVPNPDDPGEDKGAEDLETRDHPYDGTHTHSHDAMGSQGDDETHTHSHSHSDDSSHDHSHGRAAPEPAPVIPLPPDTTRSARIELESLRHPPRRSA